MIYVNNNISYREIIPICQYFSKTVLHGIVYRTVSIFDIEIQKPSAILYKKIRSHKKEYSLFSDIYLKLCLNGDVENCLW